MCRPVLPVYPTSASQPGRNSCWMLKLYISVISGGEYGSRIERKSPGGLFSARLKGVEPKAALSKKIDGLIPSLVLFRTSRDGGFTPRMLPPTCSGKP